MEELTREEPKIDDGGPAFPCKMYLHPCDTEPSITPGMSLRDYFAGQALAGEMSTWSEVNAAIYAESIARRSYTLADAMLAARKKYEYNTVNSNTGPNLA